MNQPLLSICIPTYGRVEILHNTLNSIFSQSVNSDLYEICISDNSPTDETKVMLDSFFSDKTNIHYNKSTCEGYYNSIESLKLGRGKFLKLHNNYSKFNADVFRDFVNVISINKEKKPVMFFSFGSVKLENKTNIYISFDDFMNEITYFSTWSTSFGIWKDDFDLLMAQDIELDKMFPHTSLLFALCNKESFFIDNSFYFDNQDVGKKGGYNLPETFGTRYIGLCEQLLIRNVISEYTFQKIKNGILDFISDWYFRVNFYPEKYCFSYDNWQRTIYNIYGRYGIKKIKNDFLLKFTKEILKNLMKKIMRKGENKC